MLPPSGEDLGGEEFITDWAREASPGVTFGLAVYLDRPAGLANEPAELRDGASLPLVRDYPANKASASMTSGSVPPAMMS